MDELNRFILRVKDAEGNWIDVPGLRGIKGDQGEQGEQGETGNGISGISLISTSGLVKTYRIAFTDGTHFDFNVTDGEDGDDGDDGVSPEVTIEEIEGGHQVTITDAEHPDGQSFNVMDGEDGARDAGDVTYDPDETYAEGSVGEALNSHLSQIANLEANVKSTAQAKAEYHLGFFRDAQGYLCEV